MNIELDPEELEELRRILADYLAGLREEAHHTDAREYKTQLRQEEALVQRLQQKLQTGR